MLYVGIDVHKKNLQVCVVDSDGNRLGNCRLANEPETVAGCFATIATPAAVGLEATHNWGMLYDLLGSLGFEVHICHSREAKLIGLASVKTDKVDAGSHVLFADKDSDDDHWNAALREQNRRPEATFQRIATVVPGAVATKRASG